MIPTDEEYEFLRELIAQGTQLAYQQKWQAAEETFINIKKMARDVHDIDAEAWAEQYLGRIRRDTGNHKAAMQYYERALTLAKSIGETRLVAIVLDQIGTSYRMRKDYETALRYYNEALATHPRAKPFVKGNLAILHQELGNMNLGKKLNEESKDAYKTDENRFGLVINCVKGARAAVFENDLVTAVAEALRAFRAATSVGHEGAITEITDVIHEICRAFGDDAIPVEHIKQTLNVEFGKKEKHLASTLWVNACVALTERNMLCDSAELYWALSRRASATRDNALLSFLRPRLSFHPRMLFRPWMYFQKRPIQKLEVLLDHQLRKALAATDISSTALTRLALAECLGAQGLFRRAIKQARLARAVSTKASFTETTARCDALIVELS